MYPFFRHILAVAMVMCAVSMPAQAVNLAPDIQVMSFKVSIDGKEVMAPVLGMPAAGRAEVSIGNSESDGYTLGVNMVEPTPSESRVPLRLHLELWRGSSHTGIQLLNEVMALGAAGPTDRMPGVEAFNRRGKRTEHIRIELISSATRRTDSWPDR